MENLLQGIPGVCIYIDDILITGHTEEEHLTEVLTRLSKAGLTLKKAKCSFFLEYLGHIISGVEGQGGTLSEECARAEVVFRQVSA